MFLDLQRRCRRLWPQLLKKLQHSNIKNQALHASLCRDWSKQSATMWRHGHEHQLVLTELLQTLSTESLLSWRYGQARPWACHKHEVPNQYPLPTRAAGMIPRCYAYSNRLCMHSIYDRQMCRSGSQHKYLTLISSASSRQLVSRVLVDENLCCGQQRSTQISSWYCDQSVSIIDAVCAYPMVHA